MEAESKFEKSVFSVILFNKSNVKKKQIYSTATSAKPLIYFASLFGMQMLRYFKNGIHVVKIQSKLFCLLMIFVTIGLFSFLKPVSWHDTRKDLPLHILTKTYGIISVAEVTYSIFIMSFGNSHLYVKFFKKMDAIDSHTVISQKAHFQLRIISASLITVPILLASFTIWLRTFNIVNTGQHFTYFMLMLQGTLISFFVVQIYTKQLVFNTLLLNKIALNLPPQKKITFTESAYDVLLRKIFTDSKMIKKKTSSHYCWFEMMQIYDKIADSIHYFNKIYAGQVYIMFNTWFLCTLLIICRSLSPSVKYSEVFLNDLFMYSTINARPIFLAKMCQLFMKKRNRTVAFLLQYLLHGEDAYKEQVQTLLDLVKSRKVEVSANVFTADMATVIEFAGCSISYTVLMIQYFYMHIISN